MTWQLGSRGEKCGGLHWSSAQAIGLRSDFSTMGLGAAMRTASERRGFALLAHCESVSTFVPGVCECDTTGGVNWTKWRGDFKRRKME